MASPKEIEVRVNLRVLLILAAIAVPLLLADVFFVLDRSRAALDATVGNHLKTIAEVTASNVSRFVQSKVVEVGLLATAAEVRHAAQAANQGYSGRNEEAAREKLLEIDRQWETPEVAALASGILASPASAYLRQYLTLNPSYKRLVLTDRLGAVIAASHKSIDYYQADEDWWLTTFRGGAGAIHVGDVQYDPISRSNFVAVDAAVLNPTQDQAIGVLRALVDIGEIKPITAQIQVGTKGDAMLVKQDGTIITSRTSLAAMMRKAEEMEAVAAGAAERASGYQVVGLRSGNKFVAFADPGLGQAFPELTWKILVAMDVDEARAAINHVTNRALGMAFGGLLAFGLLAAYFSMHRPQRFTEVGEGLHELKGPA
jgi:hypothetical protein